MAILIAYASKYGATRGIAERIGATFREMGQDVDVRPANAVLTIGAYDAFVVGSAVYSGSWLPEATEFVRRNSAVLSTQPVWMFSSGPLGPRAHTTDDHVAQPDVVLGEIKVFGSTHTIPWPIPKEVVEFRSSIRPREHEMFFGALDRRNLGFVERMAMKAVGSMEGDFRDWPGIEAWAEHIARALAPAVAAPNPG